ncbi:transposase [Erythromicrobium ramosum]|uniref:Transposase n=1 Tax=Erythrobacter ramosus TaxID=35811 RepID=A0A6I4UEQ6_9SPHN|nr:IS110 family transposase [Erythrobacter ramosus]MBB3775008.1 transposase [Erythrobacter ramosus]MXP37362.1 IS110 family transposase [Erythrobacter ramosus]
MAIRKYWVGLDTGFSATAVCLIDEHGEILFEGMRDTNAGQVKDILRRFGVESVELITIEAGVGTHMVRELREYGLPVQVVEVRKASKFLAIRRQKTDANDARGLAELGRLGRSLGAGVFVKTLDCQNIRSQLNVRKNLVQQRIKIDALVQSIVRLHGGTLSTRVGIGKLASGIEDQLPRLQGDGLDVDAEVRPLVEIAESLRFHIAGMDKRFKELTNDHPVCSVLMTVPGVGPITALSFFSAIGDPFRFDRNRDVGPYLGLTPSVHQSGVLSRPGRISRFGNKLTRTHLVSAATVLLCSTKRESALQIWGLELSRKVGLSKARVAVARKMAVIMLGMWKSGSTFDPGHT